MTVTANSIPGKNHSGPDSLCINIEPSVPLILAISQLFRDNEQAHKAIDLCRLGLNYFPGNMGLRLEMAMAYWELKELDRAWSEILAVARELNKLAPTLEKITLYSRQAGRDSLSEWFGLLSKITAQYPSEESPKGEVNTYPSDAEIVLPQTKPDTDLIEEKEERPPNSKVLSTLNDWLSQLKEKS